jgi:tRNA-dihydrouridine synthase
VWCPAPKIMKLGAWSALMLDKENTLDMIKTLSNSISKPFSIKTRVWINQQDKEKQKEFILKASKHCWLISIHWRTLNQWHTWEADLDFVLDIKKQLKNTNCKIIFNGWIDREKLQNKEFLEKISILDGIMIWQKAIWDPWIFTWYNPSWEEKKQVILQHLRLSIKYKTESRAVVEFRKFIGSYIKWMDNASSLRVKLMQTKIYKEVEGILNKV